MPDDLDLGFSQPESPGGPPSYRRRRLVVALVALAVVAVLVLGGVVFFSTVRGWFGAPADYSGAGSGTVVVEVQPGDSLTAIGQALQSKGVVASVGAFTDAADGNSSIGPGFYQLHRHMQASLAVKLLLDPASLLRSHITIPEGRRLRDILAAIADGSDISLTDLKAAAASPADLGVPRWGAGHPLEGFLFPATYDFPPGTTATEALRAMVTRFNQEAASLNLAGGAHQLGYSPYEVLTIASIIEREGRLTSDFPKIAEVFYNRLHQGMGLGSDATLFYVLPPDHGPLSNADLQIDSPYNTRLNTGLPPTPIASPGSNALSAALHPATGPYLYFVTIDKSGRAAFATTLDEFNRLVAESRRNGVQ
ncbi:MAG: hypothetical protein QOJ03_427 [Frankiaceae bacterium]|jgi:UPF0755 protein|nr:hypothetical protein [Frankiaceae bacterium]